MIREVNVLHYEAFSRIPGKGNPAGIVVSADGLSEADMQRIAAAVGFNETTFLLPSDTADIRLRYFTPGHEMNLCGHATVASLYHLKCAGWREGKDDVTVETAVGVLPMRYLRDADGDWSVRMRQDAPRFEPFAGDRERLAHAIGLDAADLHPELPIVYGSTGIWTLLVPIASLEAFDRMRPDNALFPDLLHARPSASIHPFTLETVDPASDMHARHFSSPYSGTVEDPVTGTASGAMAAYALTYPASRDDAVALTIEQGLEIGRDGRVMAEAVRLTDNQGEIGVWITGQAVFVRSFDVTI